MPNTAWFDGQEYHYAGPLRASRSGGTDEPGMTPERRREILAQSEVGRTILAEEDAARERPNADGAAREYLGRKASQGAR